MTSVATIRSLGSSARRNSRATLLIGVAVAALSIATANAAPTPSDDAGVNVPAPAVTPPDVTDRDFAPAAKGDATGSVDTTAPNPGAAAPTPAPVAETPKAPEGVPAAIVSLVDQTGPGAQLKISQADRDALKAFYDARQGAPLWFVDGHATPKADAARKRVEAAADDGLDASRFRFPSSPTADDIAAVALAEAQFTVATLDYARQAWGGRVAPSVVSPNIAYTPDPFDAAAALASLDQSQDVVATLDGFNPQHPQFQALRKLLIEARGNQPHQEKPATTDLPKIAFGKLLTPGDDDPRVPDLRKRLHVPGDQDDLYYDDQLAEAVIAFQKAHKIGSSGLVNRQTVRTLNGELSGSAPYGVTAKGETAEIEINMERWRWLPRNLGSKYVFVDLPDFHLHIMEGGKETYQTRVIIGRAGNQTPLLSSAINQIVVNPYWNVPVSIALKELSRGSLRGFEVVDSRGHVVSPESVDWESIKAQKMRIRQPPGERNALGHIKFLFPNKFSVYLHDTSSRGLFSSEERSLSHGCVRVDKPLEFADALTGDQGWGGARLGKMIGGKEQGIPLSSSIPVYLTYFTSWVDDDGKLKTRPDLYSLDNRLKMALRGEPLPPLPAPEPLELPKIAKLKPKPKTPASEQTAAAPAAQPVQVRDGPAAWLSRLFGDSRY